MLRPVTSDVGALRGLLQPEFRRVRTHASKVLRLIDPRRDARAYGRILPPGERRRASAVGPRHGENGGSTVEAHVAWAGAPESASARVAPVPCNRNGQRIRINDGGKEGAICRGVAEDLSLIHISEPTR